MEGLEVSEVSIADLDLSDRADAEYVSKENLRIEHLVKHLPHRKLGSLCELIASAFYPSATDLYGESGLPFIRCVDCIDFPVLSFLQNETFERLPVQFVEENPSIRRAGKGDLVITKVGSPCFASVIHEHDELALSRTVLGAVGIKDVDPYYLMAFLRAHHGFSQLMKQREQTIQFQLTLERVRDVDVYTPSPAFQHEISKAVKESFFLQKSAQIATQQAEQTLLHALGLDTWTPPEALSYERSSREAFAAGRLDAEHFHERYYALADKLQGYSGGVATLGEICPNPMNGVEIREYIDEGVPYLRVGDISNFTVDPSGVKYVAPEAAAKEIDKVRLQTGDVLISRSGSLAVTGVVEPEWTHSLISSHLILVRLQDASFQPHYVAAFLSAMPGRMQIIQNSNGGVQPEINQPSLKRVLIPRLAQPIQTEITNNIQQAKHYRQRATDLLDAAKRAVEIAIEDSEAAALDWLCSMRLG